MTGLVTVNIDTSDLMAFTRRLEAAQRVTTAACAVSLNEVGDNMVAVMATSIAKDTGLEIEQVRGLMRVRRATRSNLNYELDINPRLYEDAEQLQGRRESTDFGKRRPGQLVIIVSKKDDLVCMDCEELAAAGPIPIETARSQLPKHPHCRCIMMPYVQKGKRLPVTMTTVSGTSAQRRMGNAVNESQTLRQLAQSILNRTSSSIKIELR